MSRVMGHGQFVDFPACELAPRFPETIHQLHRLANHRHHDRARVVNRVADHLVSDATKRLEQLENERVDISLQGREAVREGARTRNINARKKELHAEITDAEQRLGVLRRFERDLARAVGVVGDLLRCPTCNTRADARRHFKSMGQHFSCTCSDCSTTWGTIACGRCSKSIPVLRLHGTAWMTKAGEPGWVDRTLGADVLAVPRVVGSEIEFVCPSCC